LPATTRTFQNVHARKRRRFPMTPSARSALRSSPGRVERSGDPTPRKVGPNTIEDFPGQGRHSECHSSLQHRPRRAGGRNVLPSREWPGNRPAYSKPDSFAKRRDVGEGQWKLLLPSPSRPGKDPPPSCWCRLRAQRPGRNRSVDPKCSRIWPKAWRPAAWCFAAMQKRTRPI